MSTAIVFIPGMWSTDERMKFWRTRAEKHMPAYAINLDRSNITKKRFRHYVTQTEEFIESIPESTVIPVGHSMGGLIAQKIEHPKIVARILAAPAAPRGVFAIDNFTQIGSMLCQLNQAFKRETATPTAFWAKRLVFNAHEDLGLAWDHSDLQPQSYRVFEECLFGVPVPQRNDVEVILVGSKDKIIPVNVQRRLARYHNTRLKIFPGHDHGSICQTEEVADFIIQSAMKHNGMPTLKLFGNSATTP